MKERVICIRIQGVTIPYDNRIAPFSIEMVPFRFREESSDFSDFRTIFPYR